MKSKTNCHHPKTHQELVGAENFFKAVQEGNRLRILCFLKKEKKCVCEIWQYLRLPQNLISHHLKVLKDAGLIKCRKNGLKVFCEVNKKNIDKYFKLIHKFLY